MASHRAPVVNRRKLEHVPWCEGRVPHGGDVLRKLCYALKGQCGALLAEHVARNVHNGVDAEGRTKSRPEKLSDRQMAVARHHLDQGGDRDRPAANGDPGKTLGGRLVEVHVIDVWSEED